MSEDRDHLRSNESDDNMRYNLWGRFVLKKLAYPVVWVLLKLGVSANTVTGFGFLVACSGCLLIATGSNAHMVVGVALVNVWALLDYADGQVARWNRTSGNYGRFFDNVCDISVAGLLFLCLGIGVNHSTGEYIYLILGAWCSICYLLTMVISYSFERLISPQLVGFVSSMRVRWLPANLVQTVGFNLQNVTGLIMPAILIGVVFGFLPGVLVLWSVIGTGGVCFMAYSMLKRAGSAR